jgi:hypothetical protein
MSTPPVQAALALYNATNRDDRQAVLDLMHTDVEIVTAAAEAMASPRSRAGHSGLRRFWARLDAQGRKVRVAVREAQDVEGRAVCKLAVTNEVGGKHALAEVVWAVVTVDDEGLIVSTWSVRSEREALEAAERGAPA